jgi:trimethylamine--corrinoid protein Co-methyltransferase
MNKLDLPNSNFTRLIEEQQNQMKGACLEILERTGVRLYNQEALDLLRRSCVEIEDGNLVRIPAPLVEKAIAMAPRCVTLYDRNGETAMWVLIAYI